MQDSVHYSPSDIAREARTLAQSLKEAVKKDEVLDKDVEFKRKSLRRHQLKLLLLHPISKEAKDVETHLWMQTSYQFISVYKQQLTMLDRKLFSPAAESSQSIARHGLGEGGHVEYRKTLSRFRQFLAEEERFYVQLLIRYQSQFGLTEARAALIRADVQSADPEDVASIESGRSLFPDHAGTLPKDNDERQSRLATFTKLLVCLGDITRYREQYNDGGGRPRAGHEEGPPRRGGRGGGRRGHEPVARPRNYTRARNIYEQARMLIPDDGNAFHQLAVLSSYQRDTFGSLLNYYRALCVRQPYDTASDNLNTVLKKALDRYRASKGSTADDPQAIQKARVDRFLELTVVLHGLWYLDSDERATRASKHSRSVAARFRNLIAEPALPANIVSEVLILAFCALWKVRMVNDEKVRAKRTVIEPLIAMHVLSLSRALLDTARVQLSVQIEDVQDKADLAQKITRVFRRILPAMRIVSKWLRTNMKYLVQLAISESSPGFLKNAIKAFWESYSLFLTSLGETFPLAKLPALKRPLDEDSDLQGFPPIRKGMFVQRTLTQNDNAVEQEVHPNEEYLMRISDLLLDAQQIAAIDASPISLFSGKFAVAGERRGDMPSSPPSVTTEVDIAPRSNQGGEQEASQDSDNEDDGNTERTSRTGTEDDIVREAFKEALRDDVQTDTELDDEEDERIVWSPPRAALPPLQKIVQPPQMSPQVFPSIQSPKTATASPTRALPPPTLQQPSGTTAQDLLNNVLGFTRSKIEQNVLGQQRGASPVPQTSLLFGNGTFDSPTKSIWGSGHLGVAPLPPSVSQHGMGNIAPGHERVRSQSFSISQAPFAQPSSNIQDSIYGSMGHVSSALPTGPLSGNSGCFGGHHHSLSFSGSQSAFRNMPIHSAMPLQTQIYYDSHHSQLPPSVPPPAQIQGTRLQGYAGQQNNALSVPDPFVFYETQGTNAFSNVQSSTSVNQSIWGRKENVG